MHRLDVEAAEAFAAGVLRSAGLSQEEAAIGSRSLVLADMRGHGTHGLSRLGTYASRVRAGVVNANVTARIVNQSPTALSVDGGNGIGMSVGIQVMDMCIQRARQHGCCFAAVNHANHFGIACFYTMHAAGERLIGLAASNAPASVVPTGGSRPMLGTNPLSIAVPAGKHPPLVLDMATSVVAQGKVILAVNEGKPSIPGDWAVDERGVPTTDARAALRGAMLPFGGPKGYAISFIIDILCSALSGALSGTRIHSYWKDYVNPQDLGYFMGALDVESFLDFQIFAGRVDALFEEMKACPPAPGNTEVFIPGEIEHRRAQHALVHGIEVGDAVYQDLEKVAREYGVELPRV